MQQQSILITGGTGNIGQAVVSELQRHHYDVAVLCRSEQSAQKASQLGARVVLGDINQPQTWLAQLDVFDGLIHLACGFGEDMAAVDLQLVQAIISQCEHRSSPLTLLYTAGCWTYGSSESPITEQDAKQAIPSFQWMLDHIELLKDKSGIDLRIVSPVNVVSETERNVPPILLWELERNGQPCVVESSSLQWSLVERNNLAQLYRLVLLKGRAGHEYIGAGDASVSVGELATGLSDQPVKVVPVSQWQQIYGDWALGYSLNQPFSSAKAISELGWQPRPIFS